MDVILLERVAKLGQMGEVVSVKQGYARNFLLPQGKALRVNAANMARFEAEKAQLEARNLETKAEAQSLADKLDGESFIVMGLSHRATSLKLQTLLVSQSTSVRLFWLLASKTLVCTLQL